MGLYVWALACKGAWAEGPTFQDLTLGSRVSKGFYKS